MQNRFLVWLLIFVAMAMAASCGDDTNTVVKAPLPTAGYLSLMNCTEACWQDLGEYLGVLAGIFKYIDYYGPLPPGVTYSRLTGSYNFELDLDDEVGDETLVNGEIWPGLNSDLSDGFDLDEVAVAHWTMRIWRDVADYDTTGEGYFSLWRMSPTAIRMTIVDPDREDPQNPFIRSEGICELELTSYGVHFDSLRRVDPENPLGRVFTGVTEFITRTTPPSTIEDSLLCLATFDGSDTITVTVNFKGDRKTFAIDRRTFEVIE